MFEFSTLFTSGVIPNEKVLHRTDQPKFNIELYMQNNTKNTTK